MFGENYNMQRLFILLLLSGIVATASAQNEGSWTVSFPITDYIVSTNDTVSIVQVQLPDGHTPIPVKTMGILRGANRNNEKDTANVGWGRCQLIKGDFYYFGLKLYRGRSPHAGDLVYVILPKPATVYGGRIPELACHSINLVKVTEEAMYQPSLARSVWSKEDEARVTAEMVEDIRYTAREMRKQMPGVDQVITTGIFKDKKLFDAMEAATENDLLAFLDYVIARPRLYAGNTWKISETFATWMTSGTPTVVKN